MVIFDINIKETHPTLWRKKSKNISLKTFCKRKCNSYGTNWMYFYILNYKIREYLSVRLSVHRAGYQFTWGSILCDMGSMRQHPKRSGGGGGGHELPIEYSSNLCYSQTDYWRPDQMFRPHTGYTWVLQQTLYRRIVLYLGDMLSWRFLQRHSCICYIWKNVQFLIRKKNHLYFDLEVCVQIHFNQIRIVIWNMTRF